MRDKAKAWLARFSLYDTRGLSATVRKNLRLVILGVVIGNFSFTITGEGYSATKTTNESRRWARRTLSMRCCWRCPISPSSCS